MTDAERPWRWHRRLWIAFNAGYLPIPERLMWAIDRWFYRRFEVPHAK